MSEKIKVMLAENDMPLAMWIISVLTIKGFDVRAVFNGRKALAVAAETRFDLIIVEAAMPDINGYDICRDLKQRHISWKTPIILVSASATIEDQQRALEIGATDFIEKPFGPEDFSARVLLAFNQSCQHEA